MKKLCFILGLSLVMGGLSAESPMKIYRSQNDTQRSTKCDKLNKSEMEFSELLSSMQQEIFCSVFDDQQRDHAMEIFHMNKSGMSADAAVEKVIVMHRDPAQQHKSMKQKSMKDKTDRDDQKNKRSYYY
jgi:hypothetical protein